MLRTISGRVRAATREWQSQRALAVTAIITLSLAIGAATVIFSLVRHVLVRPLPYRDAHSVYVFKVRDPARTRLLGRWWFQPSELLTYQSEVPAFGDVMGATDARVLYVTREGTERLDGALVTSNAFRFLGLAPVQGRPLTESDVAPGAPRVFVMSHRLWTRLGPDVAKLGHTFTLNGQPTTLVGVLPPRVALLGADVWMPVSLERADSSVAERFFYTYTRLKPGVGLPEARAQFDAAARRVATERPAEYPERFVVEATGWLDELVGDIRPRLRTLTAAVALLVLMACGNVAVMLLARATARRRAMAVRMALGATRGRLVGDLMAEGLVLAAASALAGLALAHIGLQVVLNLIPAGLIPLETDVRLDAAALVFAMTAACMTVLAFALVPAWHATGIDLATSLKKDDRAAAGARSVSRLRDALVVAEVTMAFVLLAGAGLFMRTYVNLETIRLGFAPAKIEYLALSLPAGRYTTVAEKEQLVRMVLQRVRDVGAVESATAAAMIPPFTAVGATVTLPERGADSARALLQFAGDDYFATLGMPIRVGRPLTRDDQTGARRVAVINETFARAHFPNVNPIGRAVRIRPRPLPPPDFGSEQFQVVGVVADARNRGIREPAEPQAFIPLSLTAAYDRVLLMRTSRALGPTELRRVVWASDPSIAVLSGTLSDDMTRAFYAAPRFALLVLGAFAAVGLVLAVLGVHGVVQHLVAPESRAIAIRIALGAPRHRVTLAVVGSAAARALLGVVVGLGAAWAGTRLLAGQIWGVTPLDPLTFAAASVLLVGASVVAALEPALAAASADLSQVMRAE